MVAFWELFATLVLEVVLFSWSRTVRFCFWLWFWFTQQKSERLPPIRQQLLLRSASELAAEIREGKVKSVDLVHAYIDRSLAVQGALNAVVEDRFEAALRDAEEADRLVRSGTLSPEQLEREKPLLGVPFTAKNSIAISGLVQDAGSAYYAGQRADQDAAVVALLRQAGAIPLALTNVPELCAWGDSHNRLQGSTRNPYDTRRSPGGSSGGEGALIAAAGSLMGIGTDLVGSIRVPSAYCGIYGHKPTAGTVSNGGVFPRVAEHMAQYNCTGPMCRFVEDLAPMLKVMAGPNAAQLRLDEKVDVRDLRIYYVEDEGATVLSRVDREARHSLHKVVKFLQESHGVTPVLLRLAELRNLYPFWLTACASSNGADLGDIFKHGQEKMNLMKEALLTLVGRCKHSPAVILLSWLTSLAYFRSEKRQAYFASTVSGLQQRLEDLLGTDGVLLLPTNATSAPYHHQDLGFCETFSMTCMFNFLGFPSTACPVAFDAQGLPLGVQVAAARGQDRLCLAVASEIDQGFGGWKQPWPSRT
ncbi:LOW QUALITY PROTEIN: fatty-acid amide hydrolase 2-A [Ixodes scapularis]|uniref:LOW QUALITY PROTEIN: fatty-acid amide hydrolase 2-A n=1 Tax=Ixodes scapularis TaxID=6945 RepID=UPI001C382453|nr:LOW QUALITY PROTEIN: fatty-acid amide hydrolase 2-A [Ixodes scapularis]